MHLQVQALNLDIFTRASPGENSSSGSYHHFQTEDIFSFPLGSIFFFKLFPQGRGNYDYAEKQNPIDKKVPKCKYTSQRHILEHI